MNVNAKKAIKKYEKEPKMKETEIEKAIKKNDEEWVKRMLLLTLTMILALLGLD